MTIRIAISCDQPYGEPAPFAAACHRLWTSSSLDPAATAEEANDNGWRRVELADGRAADACPACLELAPQVSGTGHPT